LDTDELFMKEAIKEARDARKHGDLPFGAIIVREGRIISRGQSREFSLKDVTCHAELEAVRLANKIIKDVDLSRCRDRKSVV